MKELQNKIIKLFDLPREIIKDQERQRRVYSINGIFPTVLQRIDSPKILIYNKINEQSNKNFKGIGNRE